MRYQQQQQRRDISSARTCRVGRHLANRNEMRVVSGSDSYALLFLLIRTSVRQNNERVCSNLGLELSWKEPHGEGRNGNTEMEMGHLS